MVLVCRNSPYDEARCGYLFASPVASRYVAVIDTQEFVCASYFADSFPPFSVSYFLCVGIRGIELNARHQL